MSGLPGVEKGAKAELTALKICKEGERQGIITKFWAGMGFRPLESKKIDIVCQTSDGIFLIDVTASKIGKKRKEKKRINTVFEREDFPYYIHAWVADDDAGGNLMRILRSGSPSFLSFESLPPELKSAIEQVPPLSEVENRLLKMIGKPKKKKLSKIISAGKVTSKTIEELEEQGYLKKKLGCHIILKIRLFKVWLEVEGKGETRELAYKQASESLATKINEVLIAHKVC